MAEDGHHVAAPVSEPVPVPHHTNGAGGKPGDINTNLPPLDNASLTSPRVNTPNPFSRKNTSLDLDDYFNGPRDIQKHSKWPIFMQMHGSILPKMILPLAWMAAWATAITLIHDKVSKSESRCSLSRSLHGICRLTSSFFLPTCSCYR